MKVIPETTLGVFTALTIKQEIEDTVGVIRNRKSKKDRPIKRENVKHQSTIHYTETNDRATETQPKIGSEFRCYGRVSSSCFTGDTGRVTLFSKPVMLKNYKIN